MQDIRTITNKNYSSYINELRTTGQHDKLREIKETFICANIFGVAGENETHDTATEEFKILHPQSTYILKNSFIVFRMIPSVGTISEDELIPFSWEKVIFKLHTWSMHNEGEE